MRAGTKIRVGFSGTISETVAFETVSAKANFDRFETFFESLPKTRLDGGRYVWTGVQAPEILGLLAGLKTAPESWKADAKAIRQYIEDRSTNGWLKHWTVVLLANGKSKIQTKIGGYPLRLLEREDRSGGDQGRYSIGRLVSPVDEMADLSEPQAKAALASTLKIWSEKKEPKGDRPERASGPCIRLQRDRNAGLLLVYPIDGGKKSITPLMGFAVSFPFDTDGKEIEYAENSVKQLEDLFD